MSVLFPKVNKMPEWDYRPIYYDPEKEKREKRRRQLHNKDGQDNKTNGETKDNDYQPALHRGSFREARKNTATGARRTSKLAFWITLLLLLLFCFYFLF